MKEQMIHLIKENNSIENGILTIENIPQYVEKILENADIIPFFSGQELLGFIAFYNNHPDKEVAFLSLILLSKEARGKGIGKILLQASIHFLIKNGTKNYQLEVLQTNQKAKNLYLSLGFTIYGKKGPFYTMNKTLDPPAPLLTHN